MMEEFLKHLNEVNEVTVRSVYDEAFRLYGRVAEGYDVSGIVAYMKESTPIPEEGNIYVPSVPEMEELPVCPQIARSLYGGMPIQIGYCNGRNTTYNGFEYHKGNEVNVAVTGFMLVLGHVWDVAENGHYRADDAEVFYVPEGTVIEVYQTTLHFSPCRTGDGGFKAVVILPKGTNTPLTEEEKADVCAGDWESRLLFMRNKWLIAHPERRPLMEQGAFPGVDGENKELHY